MKCRLQNILPTVSLPDTSLRWAALIVCTCIPLVLLNFRSQAPTFVFEENFDECEALIRQIFPSYEPIFVISIMGKIVEMLNISTDAYLNSTGILFNFSSDYMHKEANPMIPGRRMKEDIKCKVEGSLDEQYSTTYRYH